MHALRNVDLSPDEDGADGFGPTVDLIISVMAVLLLLLTLARASYIAVLGGNADLTYVASNQDRMVNSLKRLFRATEVPQNEDSDETLRVLKVPESGDELRIRSSATNQRVSFGGQILFEQNESKLSSSGEAVLTAFSAALGEHLRELQEIHVEGHADSQPAYKYRGGNLQLAADRAVAVYRFLQENGINPVEHLMSASSFAEFKPINRTPTDKFDNDQLAAANRTENQKSLNRRIEVVLIYKLSP